MEEEGSEEEHSSEIIVPDQAQAPYYGIECPCGHITFAGAVSVGPGEPVFHTLIKQIACEKCGTIIAVQPQNVYWRFSDPNHPIRTSPFYRRHFWWIELVRYWLILKYWDARVILHTVWMKSRNALLYAVIAILEVIEKVASKAAKK